MAPIKEFCDLDSPCINHRQGISASSLRKCQWVITVAQSYRKVVIASRIILIKMSILAKGLSLLAIVLEVSHVAGKKPPHYCVRRYENKQETEKAKLTACLPLPYCDS